MDRVLLVDIYKVSVNFCWEDIYKVYRIGKWVCVVWIEFGKGYVLDE